MLIRPVVSKAVTEALSAVESWPATPGGPDRRYYEHGFAPAQGSGSHAPSKADLQKAHSPTHELPLSSTAATATSSAAASGTSGKQPPGAGRQGGAAGGGGGEPKAQPTAATPSAAELAKAAAESRVSQGAAARCVASRSRFHTQSISQSVRSKATVTNVVNPASCLDVQLFLRAYVHMRPCSSLFGYMQALPAAQGMRPVTRSFTIATLTRRCITHGPAVTAEPRRLRDPAAHPWTLKWEVRLCRPKP